MKSKSWNYILLFMLILFNGCVTKKHTASNVNYRMESILKQLDLCGENSVNLFFPDFDDPYFALSGSRVTLFGDSNRWAIVIEKTGYSNRNYCVFIEAYYYGNCLINQDTLENGKATNVKYFVLLDTKAIVEKFDRKGYLLANSDTINVRGKSCMISHDLEEYRKLGIDINNNDSVDVVSVVRYLDANNFEAFRASSSEIQVGLPQDLRKIMTINQWNHYNYNSYSGAPLGIPPSKQESYQLMSQVVLTGDTSLYKPTEAPNTDWKFWTDSGKY